jgi:hypothetical protein
LLPMTSAHSRKLFLGCESIVGVPNPFRREVLLSPGYPPKKPNSINSDADSKKL